MNKINRLEEIGVNKYGSIMKIIVYNDYDNIIVEFQDNYKCRIKTRYTSFRDKTLINPYDKTVHRVGYLGCGEYKVRDEDGNLTKVYSTWYDMISRCYSDYILNKHITYRGCSVYEEWHNFQNFAEWFKQNHYEINDEQMNLDKDILIKGNKVYSPQTCIFVPKRINMLFVKANSIRNNLPIGIFYDKPRNKYVSKISINGKTKSLGRFNEILEAFNTYKNFKENYIKQIADEYKDKIPQKLYEAMYAYQVEITD